MRDAGSLAAERMLEVGSASDGEETCFLLKGLCRVWYRPRGSTRPASYPKRSKFDCVPGRLTGLGPTLERRNTHEIVRFEAAPFPGFRRWADRRGIRGDALAHRHRLLDGDFEHRFERQCRVLAHCELDRPLSRAPLGLRLACRSATDHVARPDPGDPPDVNPNVTGDSRFLAAKVQPEARATERNVSSPAAQFVT